MTTVLVPCVENEFRAVRGKDPAADESIFFSVPQSVLEFCNEDGLYGDLFCCKILLYWALRTTGLLVGLVVGKQVDGVTLGNFEGAAVGDVVGIVDGVTLGDFEGAAVGDVVGIVDGVTLGDFEGAAVGDVVGIVDGDAEGIEVIRKVGTIVDVDGLALGEMEEGRALGLVLGLKDGDKVLGLNDGTCVGLYDGETLGLVLGLKDGEALGVKEG